jgi:hypothetical protein
VSSRVAFRLVFQLQNSVLNLHNSEPIRNLVPQLPAVLTLLLTLAACTGHPSKSLPAPPAISAQVPAADLPCIQTTHGCLSLNPDVTQENLGSTICMSGYTKSVRPASVYTNGVKAKLLREAGLPTSEMPAYELDHVIPLALGGHPRKLSNLQLQPWEGEHGAKRKDVLEIHLHSLVCHHKLTLHDAQTCIAENWDLICLCQLEHCQAFVRTVLVNHKGHAFERHTAKCHGS